MSRSFGDRYGRDVLSVDPHAPCRREVRSVPASTGLVVECAASGFCGAVVGIDRGATGTAVVLEDRHGVRRSFLMTPAAFLLEGELVTLTRPTRTARVPRRTASGSVAVEGVRARVARPGRIWVEGRHDAELVEKVWGEDLRLAGVVVEPLHGIDTLPDRIEQFGPSPERRLGVLVDHLVPGSKETGIAQQVSTRYGGAVKVLGHPYVDVWAGIRPAVLGIARWPQVPRGTSWKHGVLQAFGRPARTEADIAAGWRWLFGHVRTYADLEPALTGRVEELIDFVTTSG